jgi:hypothetical protein
MKPAKDLNQSSAKRPATTNDELKLVCKKLADVDALWRTSDFPEPPPLKRAA